MLPTKSSIVYNFDLAIPPSTPIQCNNGTDATCPSDFCKMAADGRPVLCECNANNDCPTNVCLQPPASPGMCGGMYNDLYVAYCEILLFISKGLYVQKILNT